MVMWFKVHTLIIIAKIITSLLKLSNQIGPKALGIWQMHISFGEKYNLSSSILTSFQIPSFYPFLSNLKFDWNSSFLFLLKSRYGYIYTRGN